MYDFQQCRMRLLGVLHFILQYVMVSKQSHKHLHMNAHNRNTFAPKQFVLRETWYASLTVKSQDR